MSEIMGARRGTFPVRAWPGVLVRAFAISSDEAGARVGAEPIPGRTVKP
jgi:hypothetical protein